MVRRQELAVLLILAVVGVGVFGYFVTSSPTAGVQVNHSQGTATDTARAFLDEAGYDAGAYRTSTVFRSQGESATFIQRRLDGPAERTAIRENDIYGWETRFYQSLEQEAFRVTVDSRTGEVVGFAHDVPDEAGGGSLSQTVARERAASFLRGQGHILDTYELISSSTTERANRVDHTFVWEHTTREVAGAPHRLEVTLHGERIGGYNPHIKVPDDFTHQYQVQQNRGQLLSFAFLGASLLLVVIAIWLGLRYYKNEEFDSRFGLTVGGVVAALTVVGVLNSIPQLLHSVPTTMVPWQFLLLSVGSAAVGGLVIGGVAALMAGAGKQLSAEVLGMTPLSRLRTLRENAERRRAVRTNLLIGILLAGVILGIYAGFYLVGTRFFEFWLPSQPPQVGAVAMYVPALAAFVAGGTAAFWEEVTYRLFAVPLTKRYLGYTAVAVVVPAIVWGLGHSSYAVLPFWARAVEVTLIGIVLGVGFLRYGLVATVAAHFTVNAFVTAVPMLLAGTSWLVVQGVFALFIALIPLFAAGVLTTYAGPRHNSE